ncbi:MAG TPA: IS6 family transposase [Oligoflexus sp.]|uniref:IS6 family transposase n=1 Tax=Oligoflexus sp. TaxID=1971216 RepID=UPI002D434990|nr:IS6 family transposase [Oligoflexus sp.]HYX39717.1 IS6 family transposase [Oligoflexus sp.]
MLFDTSGHSFERQIIMLNVRWYLSYKLSYRDLEEMARERGFEVDHTTIYRWVIKFTPGLEKAVRRLKRPLGKSWRLDETYIKVKGQWKYLYRAVDKEGNTVDYLLTAKRDRKAAQRFLSRAIRSNGEPIKITIDKSGANTAGIQAYNEGEGTDIEIRQNKYLNNVIEQDRRPIKQLCRTTLGFKRFRTARITIGGFEAMRIIRKLQVRAEGDTSAEIFYSVAA